MLLIWGGEANRKMQAGIKASLSCCLLGIVSTGLPYLNAAGCPMPSQAPSPVPRGILLMPGPELILQAATGLLRVIKILRNLSLGFHPVKFSWVKLALIAPVPSPFLSPALPHPGIAHFCQSIAFKKSWKRGIFKEQLTGSPRGLVQFCQPNSKGFSVGIEAGQKP